MTEQIITAPAPLPLELESHSTTPKYEPLSPRAQRGRLVVIALVSVTILGLELIWTRIFSAEFFYSFAFLMLSLAVLGLGLGALALRFIPALGRDACLGPVLALCGLMTLAGPPLVFKLNLDFAKLLSESTMLWRSLAASALLASAYFFGGLGVAALFRRSCGQISRLYMADLLGAGLGAVGVIALMNQVGTPAATALIAVPVLVASVLASRGWLRLLPVVLLAGPFVLLPRMPELLSVARPERAPVILTHWDATAKLKVYGYDADYRGINIDNAANSPVRRFDGNWQRSPEKRFFFDIDVSNLISRFDHCTFLSLGAGGGGDVLQALQAGAAEVHAVEVIPAINALMRTGELAEFTGHIYQDARVRVVTEDARIYVRTQQRKFDVIYALSANSFAALASGSFALAENYLFTTEAFRDYWDALTDGGFMMVEHQFYVPRLVPALIDALAGAGVAQPGEHFAVYDLPRLHRQMILISKRPLTDEIRDNAFGPLTAENYGEIHLLYPAPEALGENLINRIVRDGWRAAAATVPVNIAPCTDDRPFVGQMGRWANFHWEKPKAALSGMDVRGYPYAQLMVVLILLVTLVLIVPLNLLPAIGRGPRLGAAPWMYFFAIGVAFMAVEVVLIQKYTLFVGPSAYSIATLLVTLLIGAALGSRWSARVGTLPAFTGLVLWLLLEAFVLQRLALEMTGAAPALRIGMTVVLVAPLGFFMGMPFPKGAARVGTLVDWGLAVNGAASVVGAAGGLLVAMTFGFRAALLSAAALYVVAGLLLALGDAGGNWVFSGESKTNACDARAV